MKIDEGWRQYCIPVSHYRSTCSVAADSLVNSFVLAVALTLIAASFASLDRVGSAIASLASLKASAGLDPLDTLARLDALNAFVGVNALDALARLDS